MKTIFILLARLIAIWFRTDKNNIMEQFFVVFRPWKYRYTKIFSHSMKINSQLCVWFIYLVDIFTKVIFTQMCIILQLLLVHCEKNFCRKSLGNIIGQLFWNVSFLSFIIISLICYNEVIKSSLWSFEEYLKMFSRFNRL